MPEAKTGDRIYIIPGSSDIFYLADGWAYTDSILNGTVLRQMDDGRYMVTNDAGQVITLRSDEFELAEAEIEPTPDAARTNWLLPALLFAIGIFAYAVANCLNLL